MVHVLIFTWKQNKIKSNLNLLKFLINENICIYVYRYINIYMWNYKNLVYMSNQKG